MSHRADLISTTAAGVLAGALLLGGEALAITQTLTPPSGITDDSYLESASQGNANGTKDEMNVKRDSSNARMDSLVKIDLRLLNGGDLTGITINGVTLRLFMHDAPGGTGSYGVYKSGNTTWVESTVTFTNFGALPILNGADLLASVVPGSTDNVAVDWTSTQLRDHVQALVDGAGPAGAVPMTLVIRDNSTTADREAKFRTRNLTGSGAADRHPRFIVDYTEAPEEPLDTDGDGVPDDEDICPGGDDNVDSDADETPDFCDVCPFDPDDDVDNDGFCAANADGPLDNCPLVANPAQIDTDEDGVGDACDPDIDNDGVPNEEDECPLDANNECNPDTDPDGDGDGVTDLDDSCLTTPAGEAVDEQGCSIAENCPCENEWKNHGAYVSCVAKKADEFFDLGLIFGEEKDAIVSAAGQSQCGSKK